MRCKTNARKQTIRPWWHSSVSWHWFVVLWKALNVLDHSVYLIPSQNRDICAAEVPLSLICRLGDGNGVWMLGHLFITRIHSWITAERQDTDIQVFHLCLGRSEESKVERRPLTSTYPFITSCCLPVAVLLPSFHLDYNLTSVTWIFRPYFEHT